jgi:type I restriction-modification system DNA methylase subunit
MARPDDSRNQPSLDEIITRSAAAIADQIRGAATLAKSEMDLQIDVAAALKKFAGDAKITLEGHHNVTIATGRPDSVYGSVIVEYKEPGNLSPNKDAAPNKAVIDQLKKRFYDMNREEHRQWNSMFGVGTDGKYFIFLRFRDDKWTDQEPLEVNRYSTERFLWALYNLGQKGKPYQPEYLHGDFGSDSQTAQEGVRALYEEILNTTNPKAQVFFNQWKILFGEVCGYDVENLSDKLHKLAEFYHVKGKTQPAQLLFAVHTYYAILIKLLASEIVSFFNPWMTRQVEKLQSANSSAKLKRELEELEQGGVFHTLGITNFLEGDLFAWYLAAWTAPVEKLVRAMVTKLDLYNPGTFSEDPAQSRDLLKKLYQQLFPKSVRHDLGEYYTPDWLAEHVLNELGYEGDPDKRLLDPACGSGTFLVMAINRIRRWYDLNREKCAYDEGELLKKILTNVIGFDLNPLAVMAARTNYLVAIKDLIRHVEGVEIPVYLCDSIMTPAEYGDLFTGGQGKVAKVPCSAMKPPHLLVPKEIAQSPKDVAMYALILETCVKNGYAPDEFLSRCRDEGLNIVSNNAHIALYKELVRLDKENKNGIWARIIKNNFAPLFEGLESFDYVVGNPPWVNWESLPVEYRDGTIDLWDQYRLRERATRGARLGNVKKELSALFAYVCLDQYVAKGGSLGFVITQSVFKTGANEGFRRFSCGKGRPFRVKSVSDLSLLLPFESAINRTAVLAAQKGTATKYPVPYHLWLPDSPRSTVEEAELSEVLRDFKIRDWLAAPVEPSVPESTWLTASSRAFPLLRKVIGDRSPTIMGRTYAGSCTWLNGVFWVETLKAEGRRTVIRNLGDVGKTKVQSATVSVEDVYLFPLLRGRDVQAWSANPAAMIIIPHYAEDFSEPVEIAELRRKNPLTFEFFKRFEKQLKARSGYKQLYSKRPEFYVVGNTGKYLLSPYKVVFKDLTEMFQCAVVGPRSFGGLPPRPVIPDHTLLFIACQEEDEAYFQAGLLNSLPARSALYSASVGVQTQRYFPTDVSRVMLPEYRPADSTHREVVRISRACHMDATEGEKRRRLGDAEMELAEAVSAIWSISGKELKHIVDYYGELITLRSREMDDDEQTE